MHGAALRGCWAPGEPASASGEILWALQDGLDPSPSAEQVSVGSPLPTPAGSGVMQGCPVSPLVRLSAHPTPPRMIQKVHTQQRFAARERGSGRGDQTGPRAAHERRPCDSSHSPGAPTRAEATNQLTDLSWPSRAARLIGERVGHQPGPQRPWQAEQEASRRRERTRGLTQGRAQDQPWPWPWPRSQGLGPITCSTGGVAVPTVPGAVLESNNTKGWLTQG